MVSLNGCCAWIAGIKVEVPIQCGVMHLSDKIWLLLFGLC